MMEENSKAKRNKPRPLYDDQEIMLLLEMVKRGRAYSNVQHDKRLTTYRPHASAAENCGGPALICGSGLKKAFQIRQPSFHLKNFIRICFFDFSETHAFLHLIKQVDIPIEL